MNRNKSISRMATTAMLIAVGILIPMIMPKYIIPPMSFTLASHVAVFLAMFLSPATAAAVAVGTTAGFVFFSGLPVDVWLRAASHIVWAVGGALWLQKRPDTLHQPGKSAAFCGVIALVHGALELLVILALYFGGFAGVAEKFSSGGYLAVFLLVGGGTVVHSCVDYVLSLLIWAPLRMARPTS